MNNVGGFGDGKCEVIMLGLLSGSVVSNCLLVLIIVEILVGVVWMIGNFFLMVCSCVCVRCCGGFYGLNYVLVEGLKMKLGWCVVFMICFEKMIL